MNILAAADVVKDTHAAWQVVLGMGAVVLAVVIVLMMLLLSFVKDIQASVESLLETAVAISSQTASLPKLGVTPSVLNLIIEEALVQDGYMNVLRDAFTAPGEKV